MFFEERGLACRDDLGDKHSVLELRCHEAVCRYAEVAALYNARVPLAWGWPLSKWMGFLPVEAPPPGAELK
jgi:hypothetical protein